MSHGKQLLRDENGPSVAPGLLRFRESGVNISSSNKLIVLKLALKLPTASNPKEHVVVVEEVESHQRHGKLRLPSTHVMHTSQQTLPSRTPQPYTTEIPSSDEVKHQVKRALEKHDYWLSSAERNPRERACRSKIQDLN
ncbi:Protein CBG26756 [Caenorhabditis briggsae]|uniref:Protein CBG26756 n=1 Tax=Caenorhabditis briggsae TaxID=6238 RepID=B6IED1_CAEBR|nr:Protein CBG26756 [Caenorhabditis briggsae]CAS01195.1 Protein CBG26756 [Caenorhabditis briggsae]